MAFVRTVLARRFTAATCATCVACLLVTTPSRADDHAEAPPAEPSATAEADATLASSDIDLERDARPSAALEIDTAGPPPEAPPPPPYKKTLVLDTSLGALFFVGRFGDVVQPAPWLRTQLGYEVLDWLMLFGEGELGFTDTSRAQPAPRTRAMPIFGFGGGVRGTVRFTRRFGAYLQASVGGMKADIRTNALAIIGYRNAESLDVYAAARLGVEWYQIDRHLALGLSAGVRHASGFQQVGAASDTPLAIDGAASVRYAF